MGWIQQVRGWLEVLAALIGVWLAVRYRRQDVDDKALNEKLRPLADAVSVHENYHQAHFKASKATAIAVATLQRQIDDHVEHNAQRFAAGDAMLKEIRDDIKELLKRGGAE